jgi:AcrR family transcriptional regulator
VSRRSAAPATAGKPNRWQSDGGAERHILAAAERLLQRVPVQRLSVAQIIQEAGLSRATFYFYFPSKYAVIARLLGQIMDEIYEVARPFVERADDESPYESLRRGIEAGARLWSTHRPAMRAASEHWHSVPELREMWLEVIDRFTDAFAREIDRQRSAGLAPPGVDSRDLAAALLWTTERCFYVAGLDVERDLPSEEQTAETLYALWHGAIYGGRPTARRAPPASGSKTGTRRVRR